MTSPPSPKGRLFISYGHKDARGLAERLGTDLEACGYEVWLDTKIPPGTNWVQEVHDALCGSRMLIALLSPHSVRVHSGGSEESDSVCLDEIAFARFSNPPKPILPVMVILCEPPFVIYRTHWLDMREWEHEDAYRQGLENLLQGLERLQKGDTPGSWPWIVPLAPLDFDPFLNDTRRNFCGRKWLFDEIDAWRTGLEEPALLITGAPGVGKSAIVAQLVHYNPESQVLAYHCCQADMQSTLNPVRFVRTLAAMIASKLDDYRTQLDDPIVRDSLLGKDSEKDPASALEQGILAPLQKLPAPASGPRCILIDALDESLLVDGPITIVDLLVSRLDRLPSWLRIVATTRKDPAVLNRLHGLRARELDSRDPRNQEDVQLYITRRLNEAALGDRLRRSGRSVKAVTDELTATAEGNFLYVRQALEGIERDLYGFEDLKNVPPGMEDRYDFLFRLRFPDEAGFAHARRVFQVVVAARQPLSQSELALATGLDPTEVLPVVLSRLSDYLPQRSDDDGTRRYALFHRSLADWLVSDTAQSSNPHISYYISVSRGQRRLADFCWRQFQESPEAMSPYVLAHGVTHLIQVGDLDRLDALVEHGFLNHVAQTAGDGEAIRQARRIAEEFARAGTAHWDHLVRAAFAYCELAERFHAGPHALEHMVHSDDMAGIDEIISAERDEGRRRLLILAAAEFLRANGCHDEARIRLHEAREQLHSEDYPFGQRCLAEALLRESVPDYGNEPQQIQDLIDSENWYGVERVMGTEDSESRRGFLALIAAEQLERAKQPALAAALRKENDDLTSSGEYPFGQQYHVDEFLRESRRDVAREGTTLSSDDKPDRRPRDASVSTDGKVLTTVYATCMLFRTPMGVCAMTIYASVMFCVAAAHWFQGIAGFGWLGLSELIALHAFVIGSIVFSWRLAGAYLRRRTVPMLARLVRSLARSEVGAGRAELERVGRVYDVAERLHVAVPAFIDEPLAERAVQEWQATQEVRCAAAVLAAAARMGPHVAGRLARAFQKESDQRLGAVFLELVRDRPGFRARWRLLDILLDCRGSMADPGIVAKLLAQRSPFSVWPTPLVELTIAKLRTKYRDRLATAMLVPVELPPTTTWWVVALGWLSSPWLVLGVFFQMRRPSGLAVPLEEMFDRLSSSNRWIPRALDRLEILVWLLLGVVPPLLMIACYLFFFLHPDAYEMLAYPLVVLLFYLLVPRGLIWTYDVGRLRHVSVGEDPASYRRRLWAATRQTQAECITFVQWLSRIGRVPETLLPEVVKELSRFWKRAFRLVGIRGSVAAQEVARSAYFDRLPGARRGMRETALAEDILEYGLDAPAVLGSASPCVVRRVLRALMSSHLLGGRPETILAVMQSRQMLKAATARRPKAGVQKAVRLPDSEERLRQWKRVVPFAPRWCHAFCLTTAGLVGLVVSMLIFARVASLPAVIPISGGLTDTYLRASGWYLVVVFALYFGITHHATFPRGWARAHVPFACFLFAFYATNVLCSADATLFMAHVHIFFLYAIVIVRVLAPELLARWRGVDLIYPTAMQLWASRLISLMGFFLLSMTLGLVAFYLL